MLDESIRVAILKLRERNQSIRQIARALQVSRDAVRRVIEAGSPEVPRLDRAEKAEPHRERILELFAACEGNLVRVHEELAKEDCAISYQGLTAFCRRHQIGTKPKPRAGRYHFEPGQEMQHDTSPHRVVIGGKTRVAQCASLVFCYSRMKFVQYYPNFDRFYCKVFLADALQYFGGSCLRCMIDNTHVVVLKGTGASMIPVPEMVAFGEQLGFEWAAHEKGDANRSARVERPFHHVEHNFLPGRKPFIDWKDLNGQAVAWCDRDNARHKRHLHASPRKLFLEELSQLRKLPEWTPEVYQLHHRLVGVEGYVTVHTNLYSVPLEVPVGRQVEVRETRDRIDVYEGPRVVATHERVWDREGKRVTLPGHRQRRKPREQELAPEEKTLLELAPELASFVAQLKKRAQGSTTLALRRLLSLVRDYPRAPLVQALAEAERYGLFDLERVERMVLKRIAGDYFLLPGDANGGPDE
ncbi:MAG: transposase [Planctomycetes bacterium]|nr:transposase [Planctomycetota bacterium]